MPYADEVNARRSAAFAHTVAALRDHLALFSDQTTPQCPRRGSDCDALNLGSLTVALRQHRILPFPELPFHDHAFRDWTRGLRGARALTLCDFIAEHERMVLRSSASGIPPGTELELESEKGEGSGCVGWQARIEEVLAREEGGLEGLDMGAFSNGNGNGG